MAKAWSLDDLPEKMRQQAAEQLGAKSGIAAALEARKSPKSRPEAAFQTAVIDFLTLHKFRIFHDHDSRRNVAGLPDIIAVREACLIPPRADRAGYERPAELLALELKVHPNKPTPEQLAWLESLSQVEGVTARVLYSDEWDVLETLVRDL